MQRDQWLILDDTLILRLCTVSHYQGSGPGGQNRNRVLTGTRLVFHPLNLEIRCCETRSTETNLTLAIQRLKEQIACTVRSPDSAESPPAFPGSGSRIQASNPGYALWVARVLDLLEQNRGELRPTAEPTGMSPSALSRTIFAHKPVLAAAQSIRSRYGLPPLKS